MEKRGVVESGRTRNIENRTPEKQAGVPSRQQQIETLDDDFTKRAADATAAGLSKKSGS